jgi:hypothetical protein
MEYITMSNVQEMLVDIEKVLEAAHTIVDGMQPGERKQIKRLAEDVSAVVGRDPKEVLGYVNDYAHRTNIAYVTRGKNGGLVKGSRPAKVVKPAKVKPSDTGSTDV